MSYSVFLYPNSNQYLPKLVITSLELHQKYAFVITLDKRDLFYLVSNAKYFERTNGNKTIPNSFFIEQIKIHQPRLVVLDDCFWDYNSELLDEILTIQKDIPFDIINVLQLNCAKYLGNITTRLNGNPNLYS